MPSLVPVGGMRMSVSTASGAWVSTAASSSSCVSAVPTSSTSSTRRQQRGCSLAHEVVILREHHPDACADGTRAPPARKASGVSIKVVLGEDNVLVREGVRALLDSYDDIEVVGVAEDAPTLLAAAGRARARRRGHRHQDAAELPARRDRLRALDPRQPPRHRRGGASAPTTTRNTRIALLGRGHSGLAYLLKDRIAQGDELARAIREVHAGGSTVDPSIAERLSGRQRRPPSATASCWT